MEASTLTAALDYAAHGFRVLPLKPGTKVPDVRHWPEEASTDPDVIRRQFELSLNRDRRRPDVGGARQPNVGIVTGNGLVVVDVDTHHGGEIPSWVDTSTLAVKTASGGLHYYFATDRGALVPNSVGRLATGVDVRGERGQVAAPPSIIYNAEGQGQPHATGRYRWVDSSAAILRIDAELLIPEDMKRGFAGRSIKFEYQDDVPIGQRNNYLTSLAGYLYSTGETQSEVLAALRDEVQSLGFNPRQGEVEQIARSIARYH